MPIFPSLQKSQSSAIFVRKNKFVFKIYYINVYIHSFAVSCFFYWLFRCEYTILRFNLRTSIHHCMFLTVVMFSNRLIPHLFSKKIHASTLKKSLLSLFPYFHFCIFNIKTMHITWLESVIGISKDLFHFNLRYKFLLNYFPLTSLATASYGLTSQFLLTATICHLNHRLYVCRYYYRNTFYQPRCCHVNTIRQSYVVLLHFFFVV